LNGIVCPAFIVMLAGSATSRATDVLSPRPPLAWAATVDTPATPRADIAVKAVVTNHAMRVMIMIDHSPSIVDW
jgi:hypothetical protein